MNLDIPEGKWMRNSSYYRSPTELREGNVFICACPSIICPHNALGITARSPPQGPSPPTQAIGHLQAPVLLLVTSLETCSNLLLLGSLSLTSGGHQGTYGWQAGGTCPTEMFSCYSTVLAISAESPVDDLGNSGYYISFYKRCI